MALSVPAFFAAFLALVACQLVLAQQYIFPASTLPPTPSLPDSFQSGYVNLSTVDIWYAMYGPSLEDTKASCNSPVIFLHGGLSNSDYFGLQIAALLSRNPQATLISIDSRMQGRSTGIDQPISYDLMRDDVIGVLDHFAIPKANLVGWSDGAIIGLDMAINNATRLDRLFAFAGQYVYSNINATVEDSPVWQESGARVEKEYEMISPTPNDFQILNDKLANNVWATLPNYTQSDFAKIPTLYKDCEANPFIWIVDGADEEAINRDVPKTMHDWIPASQQLILPGVSHFG